MIILGDNIKSFIRHTNNLFILTPTRRYSEKLWDKLDNEHLLRPDIYIYKFSDFFAHHLYFSSRKMLDYRARRLLIKKICTPENLFNTNKYQGIIDLLGKAIDLFKNHQLTDKDVKYKQFNYFYEKYELMKNQLNFHDLSDRLIWCLSKECLEQNPKQKISDSSFLLIGNYYQIPIEKNLIKFLIHNAKSFFVYNTDTKQITNEFDFNFYNHYSTSHKYYNLYYVFSNRFQEVTYLARRIYLMLENGVSHKITQKTTKRDYGVKIDEINVVVTDDSYFSLIENIFPKYGIKYDLRKNYTISSSPIYTMIKNILNIFTDCYNRNLLFHFFDNNLISTDIDIQFIDTLMRYKNQNNLRRYLEHTDLLINNLTDREKEKFPPKKIKQEFYRMKEIISKYFDFNDKLVDKIHFVIRDRVIKIIEDFKIKENLSAFTKENIGDEIYFEVLKNKKVLGIIEDILEDLPKTYETYDIIPQNIREFNYEFNQWIVKTEYQLRSKFEGIDIFGVLESVEISGKYLFVLGLNEGNMPEMPSANFLLNPLKMKFRNQWKYIFDKWALNYENVYLFSPQTDLQGETLQKSTFLEELIPLQYKETEELLQCNMQVGKQEVERASELVKIEKDKYLKASVFEKAISVEEQAKFFVSKNKKLATQELALIPIINRINQVCIRQANGLDLEISEYEGKIRDFSVVNNVYSATKLDLLARCPMKYFFQELLKITPLEEVEEEIEARIFGSILHSILEEFGKRGGFKQKFTKDDTKGLARAGKMLKEIADEIIRKKRIRTEELFVEYEFEQYLKGLDNSEETGILKKFLELDLTMNRNYTPIKFEKGFGLDIPDVSDSSHRNTDRLWDFLILQSEDRTIKIAGKIDRIDKKNDGTSLLLYDYKTGKAKLKDIKDGISFQLPIYYLKCKQEFGEKINIACAYWELRKLNETKKSQFIGDLITEMEVEDIKFNKDNRLNSSQKSYLFTKDDEIGINIERLKERIFEIDRRFHKGIFHTTELDTDKAGCRYCQFRKVCRRKV